MRRCVGCLLAAVTFAGWCLLGGSYSLSQTGYTNSTCSYFELCSGDGDCIEEEGLCEKNWTNYRTVVFPTADCSPFASTTCWLTPRNNVCITNYYFSSPDCSAQPVCTPTLVGGYTCQTTSP